MKQTSRENIQPKVGQCCRLSITRQGFLANHVVLIIAAEGEWCRVLDLQVYGQPNPAAGERLRWTNPHFAFEPIPVSQWPLAARHWWAAAGWMATNGSGELPASRRAKRCAAAPGHRLNPRAGGPDGRRALKPDPGSSLAA